MGLRGDAVALAAVLVFGPPASAAPIPARTPIAVFPIAGGKAVSRVETTQVDFQPGQVMPLHLHPVPVVCFVAQGDFRVKIGDAPERSAPFGSATYEAPGVTVHYFKNASPTAPARLLCAALAGADDKVISVMLDGPPAK